MKSVCFICSPSLGIVDNWLPVIVEFRKERPGVELIFVLPKSSSVNLLDPDNVLIRVAGTIFDKIVFRTHSGLWVEVSSFSQVQEINNLSPLMQKVLMFDRRLSGFCLLSILPKIILSVYKFLDIWRYKKVIVGINDFCRSVKAVLFDVYEESKDYNANLLHALRQVPKFSICHGINIDLNPIVCRFHGVRKEGEITAYLFSDNEMDYYKGTFSLADQELKVVGIPRHEKRWVERIIGEQKNVSDGLLWKDYIFLISRSLSPYFPYERKRKALEDIKRLAFEDLDIRVVVKLHPKERDDGLYERVFGDETYGIKWIYANDHPFVLGKKCAFAISFYSGVVVDMLAIGVPVIERLDLRGIDEYDNNESLRDDDGHPVLSLRYLGLVLGASDYQQLRQHACSILNDKIATVSQQTTTYNKFFPLSLNPIAVINNDILSVV